MIAITDKQRLTLQKVRDGQLVIGWCSTVEFKELMEWNLIRMGDLGRTGGRYELTELGLQAISDAPRRDTDG